VCLPHAGGGPSFFRPWAAIAPADTELHVAQLPGREGRFRDPLPTDLVQVAQSLAVALAALPPLPTVLFGHSLGALVAFELAHAMIAAGLAAPRMLAPSGRTPPHDRRGPHHLLELGDEDLIDGLSSEYGGISPVLLASPALRELYAPALRSDLRLVAQYRPAPRPALECALHVFGGGADAHAPPAALEAWRAYARGPFAVHTFDGGHFYLAGQACAVIERLILESA
jgi:surfactin synthase thioesterase subunit